MKPDPILEEVWRIKDTLSGEMAANPAAYRTKLKRLENEELAAGRKIIRSAEELRQYAAEEERRREAGSLVVRETPASTSGWPAPAPRSTPKRKLRSTQKPA